MISFSRTVVAAPGKMFEASALAKEVAALVKRVTGGDLIVATSFGGVVGEIAWLWQSESLGASEENLRKLAADADYRAILKKWEGLIVPGASRERVWVHV